MNYKVIELKSTDYLVDAFREIYDDGQFLDNEKMFTGFRDKQHLSVSLCSDGSVLINRENCISIMIILTRYFERLRIYPYFCKFDNYTRMWLYKYE